MLPIVGWLKHYDGQTFASDLLAAIIVTLMLVPQALAYAMLAGLPAEVGLYASMLPLVLYALFGTSPTLAVGPVAVASLMTASALAGVAEQGSPEYVAAALVLAALSGLILCAMGVLRLGFLAQFLSHPVVSGFVSASAVLIVFSQLGHLIGVKTQGDTVLDLALALLNNLNQINAATMAVGAGTLIFLMLCRRFLKPALMSLGLSSTLSDIASRAAPVTAVVVTTLLAWVFELGREGVALVGQVPGGLPTLALPSLDASVWSSLLPAALLISLVGFVESVSVAQTLAAKRRQKIDPDAELIALGLANVGAGVSGGSPVSGGFSRSVVNFDAGAQTPVAGALTAVGIALATLLLTDALSFLPRATLAAAIIVAVWALIDIAAIRRALAYSWADGAPMLATIILTLVQGVEAGIIAGVGLSLALFLYRTSRPHCAEVGRLPGTEHFRNVLRYPVETDPAVAILRVDESLYFANARYLENRVMSLVADHPEMKHLVLACQAVNDVDASALESLADMNERLALYGISLHLAEVKGPVMDRLKTTSFCQELSGNIFMSTFEAWQSLSAEHHEGASGKPPLS